MLGYMAVNAELPTRDSLNGLTGRQQLEKLLKGGNPGTRIKAVADSLSIGNIVALQHTPGGLPDAAYPQLDDLNYLLRMRRIRRIEGENGKEYEGSFDLAAFVILKTYDREIAPRVKKSYRNAEFGDVQSAVSEVVIADIEDIQARHKGKK